MSSLTTHRAMKFAVIVNTRSGSVPPDGDAQISNQLTRLGHEFELSSVEGADLEEVWNGLEHERFDGVIVWGGDGTLSYVLARAADKNLPVLPLPGGTMNLLPKFIHGDDCEWQNCLENALSSQTTKRLPAIKIADQMCFVGILIGRLTRLAHSREHLRSGAVASAVETLVGNDILNLKTRLDVQDEHEDWGATALGVFIPEDGENHLDIASIDPDTIGELIEMGLESLIGNWKTANGVEHKTARRLDISLKDGTKVSATLDGEPQDLEAPFSIEFCENAATVWSARC